MFLHTLPRMASRIGVVTLAIGTVTIGGLAPAVAEAPSNDDIANATPVLSLPFSDRIDTTEATSEGDIPGCTEAGHSVWYSFTPPASGDYDIDIRGSSYDPIISIFATSPFLYLFACSGGPAVKANLLGGETYYIQVAGDGGILVLNISEDVPIELSVAIAPTAKLGAPPGFPVTVSGTVTCSEDGLATVDGVLTQQQGGKVAQGTYGDEGLLNIPCSTTPTSWSRTVASSDRFLAKIATATVTASACDALGLGCDYSRSQTRDVTIKR